MPVYNASLFVGEAIQSILTQSFNDLEFLIIDDGSSDNTIEVINSFTDPRIQLIVNDHNIGVAASLNRGLSLVKSEYVARMDADDISDKYRLEKQISFMDDNLDIGVSGSWIRLFGDQPRVIERTPIGREKVKAYLLFDNPLYHPTVIIRKSFFIKYGLQYDPTFNRTEDYDLWLRASRHFFLDNIPEPLLMMRHHGKSITNKAQTEMTEQTKQLLKRALHEFHINPDERQLSFHHNVCRGRRINSRKEFIDAGEWLKFLQTKNRELNVFSNASFNYVIGMIWFRLCRNSTPLGTWVWKKYNQYDFGSTFHPLKIEVFRCWLSILLYSLRVLRKSSG